MIASSISYDLVMNAYDWKQIFFGRNPKCDRDWVKLKRVKIKPVKVQTEKGKKVQIKYGK